MTDGGPLSRATLPLQPHAATADGSVTSPGRNGVGRAESWSLVRHLFASHPIPMLVYDVEALIVLEINDAMMASYGYSRDELIGMHITRLLPPEDVPSLLEMISETVRPGRSPYRPPRLWRHVYKNGQIRDVEVAAHDYDFEGREAVLVTISDVTDRLRAEREREARGEKLRTLGQMASGVAHDLNQYLGMVAGYGDLTMRALNEASPDLAAARDALDVVVRAAMDGSVSVKRLLAFARPTQDGTADTVDVGELLREVDVLTAPRWRDAAQQHSESIAMTLEVVGDTTVKGWPSSLRDALTNLVFNAIDALPHGGTIHLSAQQHGDRINVSVADTGVGIPKEALQHVFEPFFTTKGERGTGLGLAIVYGIVERHQGVISIASPPGRGTTVTLSLPAAASVGSALSPRRAEATATAGLRILVVDDEPTITRMVAMMLGPFQHDITLASSGEEALDRLADASYDLILSDLGLGAGMNGWELLDQVRQRAPDTRFILSTGWGAQIDPAEVVARGGEGLLAKPYRLTDLLHAIAGPGDRGWSQIGIRRRTGLPPLRTSTATVSPAFWLSTRLSIAASRSAAERTERPFIPTIRSPTRMYACSAGEPGWTTPTSAPPVASLTRSPTFGRRAGSIGGGGGAYFSASRSRRARSNPTITSSPAMVTGTPIWRVRCMTSWAAAWSCSMFFSWNGTFFWRR